jgi:hypothetical protein
MTPREHAMAMANDDTLSDMIWRAQRRVIVVAPGLTTRVADTLARKWWLLQPEQVSVTLDVDPEVCRLGYGELAALQLLEKTAAERHTTLNTFPGLRIGVVIADDETLIYAPTPLHVEASPSANPDITPGNIFSEPAPIKPNAIRVGAPPDALARDLGAGPNGVKDQIIGLDKAEKRTIEAVAKDLEANPPQSFDLSRLLRVFAANIEFVELRLVGCNIRRRTVTIPSDLIGLVDEKSRKLLESKFKVLDESDAGVWGEELQALKDFIVEKFLVCIPSYGQVIRVKDKKGFDLAVRTLRKMLERAKKRKVEELEAAIDRRRKVLEEALLPTVTKNPPERWAKRGLFRDTKELLHEEFNRLFGSAQSLLDDAHVELRHKGVTYETLQDPRFIEAVRRAMPDLRDVHAEGEAASGWRPKTR